MVNQALITATGVFPVGTLVILDTMEMAVVATPDYFARHGVPGTPADLARYDCVRYRQTSSGAIFRWEFTEPGDNKRAGGHAFTVEPHGSFTTNDDDGMIRAALQGVGLVQHLELALRPWLADGQLVRVLQAWCQPFPGLYLYAPTREQMPLKVRALIDFLVEKREAMLPVATLKQPMRAGRNRHSRSAA